MCAERKERETEAIRIMVRKTQDIMPDMIGMAWEATFSLCSNFNTHKHAQLRHIFIITACNGGLSDTITSSACQSQPDTRNASYSRPQLMLLTGETEKS